MGRTICCRRKKVKDATKRDSSKPSGGIRKELIRCLLTCVNCQPCGPTKADDFRRRKMVETVNWTDPDHQRIVAACLVQSVYLLQDERTSLSLFNRHKTSKGWYEGVGFQHLGNLHEGSRLFGPILGAIFKYNPAAANSTNSDAAPAFVIAFRGTANLWDVLVDLNVFTKTIDKTDRLLHAKDEVKNFVCNSPEYTSAPKRSAPKLWIAGHSLGAAVAISVGVELIKGGIDKSEFDTFLFNPPFQSLTCRSDDPEKGRLNSVLKKFEKIVADLLKSALGSDKDADEHLYGWAPRLYVHPQDLVCMGFIQFFEEKRNENKKDILVLSQLTASDGSLVNIGWEWPKTLSANYMRSATMYVNRGEVEEIDVEEMGRRLKNIKKDDEGIVKFLCTRLKNVKKEDEGIVKLLMKPHLLEQWFDHKLHLKPQKHVHSSAATA